MAQFRAMALAILAAALPATPAPAQSPFDGTWKIDPSSIQRPPRIDVITIAYDVYTCSSCAPPVQVVADGIFHAVPGQGEFDETAVRIVDADTFVRTNRLNGRIVRVESRRQSPNGRTAVLRFTDTINPGIAPVRGTQTITRNAPAPTGSHAMSGSWQVQATSQVSANALTQTLKVTGDMLTLSTGEGFSYTARLDGTPAAAQGDPVVDTVSVRRAGERELTEIDSAQGKPVAHFTMAVSANGRRLTITSRNEKTGEVTRMIANRM